MTLEADTSAALVLAASAAVAAADLEDLGAASKAAAAEVLGYVSPPVDTGALASTVRDEVTPLGFAILAGGPRAPYAPYTGPWLDDALAERAAAVETTYVDAVRDVVDTIKGK